MNLYFLCPLWGSEALELDIFCFWVAAAGYDGVETSLPLNDPEKTERILQTLEKYGLKLLAQHWETISPDLDAHLDEYRAPRMAGRRQAHG